MADYFDLGGYDRPVTTSSGRAQAWFTRGLIWAYAFNHEEAVACFERAIDADPQCALAYWGLAYALGPNYNKPWEAFDPAETASAAAARPRRGRGSRALRRCRAGGARAGAGPGLPLPGRRAAADCSAWNRGYADAMRDVYREHPGDLDVAALFADALMNLTPWALWDTATGSRGRGSGHDRGQGGAGAGAGHARGPGAPRRPAPVHPPDGDVRPSGGRPAGRRPAPRPGPGRGTPAAHADPPGRAVRRLPAGGVRQRRRDRG